MPKTKGKKKTDSVNIPYARGFRLPTPQQQEAAICRRKNDKLPKELTPGGSEFFGNIPIPSSIDDWLAQYNEEGQTFQQFLEECPWLSNRKKKFMKTDFNKKGTNIMEKYDGFVYLLPLGDDRDDDEKLGMFSFYDELKEYAETFLGLPVKVLPKVKLEKKRNQVNWIESQAERDVDRKSRTRKTTLEARFHGDQFQLRVDCLLGKLRTVMPSDGLCLIALTMSELYESPSDLFVAGMAAGSDRVAVFSLLRYNPCLTFSSEFWYDIRRTGSPNDHQMTLLLHRSSKLLVHEVCHLLGLDHCIFYTCCMNGSGHLQEDFKQPMFLCTVDLRKLQTLVGFDIVERYNEMLNFFKKHNMEEESNWIKRRLKFINDE